MGLSHGRNSAFLALTDEPRWKHWATLVNIISMQKMKDKEQCPCALPFNGNENLTISVPKI